MPWLAEHGVSGIGMAPAIVALVLYALLPLVRSVVAGLQSVPAGVIESATGMGLTRAGGSSCACSCRWRCRCS